MPFAGCWKNAGLWHWKRSSEAAMASDGAIRGEGWEE
jgi:hypothetical protein